MNSYFSIELILLGVLSTWMTANTIRVFRDIVTREDEMANLHSQVIGAVKCGDLPRAILILEGEPGPLAVLLSSILSEATKFSPKLRVAYKVTLESLKRRSLVSVTPYRLVTVVSILVGIIGLVVSMIVKHPLTWTAGSTLMITSCVIGLVSWGLFAFVQARIRSNIASASELGRETLVFLLSPESPLRGIRGDSFPEPM